MKCILGFLVLTICAFQVISAWPARNSGGMVFYQPDYYRHRAFVMQYASQPVRAYRRQGQAAGVSAYASGKKITTGTYLNHEEDDEDHEIVEDRPQRPAQSTSIAVAHPDGPDEAENDSRESFLPPNSNNVPSRDEEQVEEEEEEPSPARSKAKAKDSNGAVTYFPINFGGNPGVVAIANSYSTGGSASSRATAYGSSAKSKSKKTL